MDDNQCFLYNGNFSNSITAKIIKINESGFNIQDESIKIKKRAIYLIGESFQNIIKHGDINADAQDESNKPEFFMTRSSNARHYITTGNLVKNNAVDNLREQIDYVNNLNKEELNALYKHQIKTGSFSEKGGAGLGIIDMARKTDQKIKYIFLDYNKESSIFYNQIEINSESSQNMANPRETYEIEHAINFHNKMLDEYISILYKGNFSEESIEPVLKIFENNLAAENLKSKILKRLYVVLIELLQNISCHGFGKNDLKQGIFSVSEIDHMYIISTGNYIQNKSVAGFSKQLESLNLKNKEELH